MQGATQGGIDCDIHPAVPGIRALLPYMTPLWRDMIVRRGVDELTSNAYPAAAPISARPDWRACEGPPGGTLVRAAGARRSIRSAAGSRSATASTACSCCSARTWRRPSPRPSTTGSQPNGSTASRACAPRSSCRCRTRSSPPRRSTAARADRRFVQVLLLANAETPLGRRAYWPIYEAAARHDLPIGIHAGSAYRHPVDRPRLAVATTSRTMRPAQPLPVAADQPDREGVFAKFPGLRVVLIESRLHLAAGLHLAARQVSGAACAWRCPGSTARRPRSSASTSA